MTRRGSFRRRSAAIMRNALFGLSLAAAGLAAWPAVAQAQGLADYDYENLRFRGVGFDVGRIWPSNLDAATTYRLRLDLGYLGPGIRIVPTISYWQTRVDDAEIAAFEEQLRERSQAGPGFELGEIELSDLTLQLDAHFVWTTPIDLLVYVGAGAGLHAFNGQGEAIDDTFVEDLFDSIMPGLTAIGGVEYSIVDRLRAYGEAHYTVVSDILSPGIVVGLSVMFPSALQGED